MEKIKQIEKGKQVKNKGLSQELYNILKTSRINKEGNFVDWGKTFNNLNIEQLIDLYNYFGVATFKNKIKLKDKNQGIAFFKNFINSFITNIKKHETLEKQLQLYIQKGISYYEILFKLNILVKYLKEIESEYKLEKNIQKEILERKVNTSRIGQKNYWPNIIKKLNTDKEIIEFYTSNNAKFSQIIKNLDKINAISFFYCLSNKIKQLPQDNKTKKFLNTLNYYLGKLGYLENKNNKNKICNRENSLNSISNIEELQLYYKKLVQIKFFSVKLKEKDNKQYINYLNILVNKIIFLYKKNGNNPLDNILSIKKIIEFKQLLNTEQINILEKIINDKLVKKAKLPKNKFPKIIKKTTIDPEKKISKLTKAKNQTKKSQNIKNSPKKEIPNKKKSLENINNTDKKLQIIINKLKYNQFYKQSYKELLTLINNDQTLDKSIFSKLISLLKSNDLLKISQKLKLSNEQKKEIILHIFFSNTNSIILIKDEFTPIIKNYTKEIIYLIKDKKLQTNIESKLLRLENR